MGFDYKESIKFFLQDNMGRVINAKNLKVGDNNLEFDVQNLGTGLYFVKGIYQGKLLTKKIFIYEN
jgi:hypothetical protein